MVKGVASGSLLQSGSDFTTAARIAKSDCFSYRSAAFCAMGWKIDGKKILDQRERLAVS